MRISLSHLDRTPSSVAATSNFSVHFSRCASAHGVATVSPRWIYDTKYNKCQRCWQTLGGDISVHRSLWKCITTSKYYTHLNGFTYVLTNFVKWIAYYLEAILDKAASTGLEKSNTFRESKSKQSLHKSKRK